MSDAQEMGMQEGAEASASLAEAEGVSSGLPSPTAPTNYEEWKAHWKRLVEAWRASGLSQAEFCRRHQLVETTFNGWKRKFLGAVKGPRRIREPRVTSPVRASGSGREGGRSAQGQAASPFVPVRITAGSAAGWAVEVVCANGRLLRLREYMEPNKLSALVAALDV